MLGIRLAMLSRRLRGSIRIMVCGIGFFFPLEEGSIEF